MSRARGKFGVKLPAISGNPDFERVFRAQMNTLEWLPIFLPSLWLFAIYIGDGIAAALGLVWVAGRILYVLGYAKAAEKRSPALRSRPLRDHCTAGSVAFGAILWRAYSRVNIAHAPCPASSPRPRGRLCEATHFTSGQPESLAAGNALSPGTTASCL